ncbi:lectin-like domain-containing protein [Actinomadura nitritigenes]|uniref:lectin-like domain-containing protein n=1 Tax=Actinomadura nitritigenes TaxID=134602 RepID=UPI003D8A0D11
MRNGALRAVASIAVVMTVTAAASAGQGSAVHREPGALLVGESFTGERADPRFIGYGAACLTGAPRGQAPAEGTNHPLGGCRRDPVGPVPPGDAATHGYLQLTDAHVEQTGAVLFDSPIPAREGLEVTFEQWQYGNTTRAPADGISFFLTDGAARLNTPGAFGGSLGYAQKLPDDNSEGQVVPGVNGGYLGIGLDVLGDYFGDGERRGNGCERRSPAGTMLRRPAPGPNIVTARGPGNGNDGYCLLAATTGNTTTEGPWPSTLPGRLHGDLKRMPSGMAPEEAEELLEPVKRTVRVRVSSPPEPMATVDVDFQDGRGFQRVLRFPAPRPVPDTVKLGFAASTGPLTDVQLIRRLAVRTGRSN